MSVLDPDNIPDNVTSLDSTLSDIPPKVWDFGHVPHPDSYQPGDIFLFQPKKPNFSQKRIQAVQRALGFNPNFIGWTHAAVYIGDFKLVEAVVSGGVRVSHLLVRCCGTDLVLARRLQNFNQLIDAEDNTFSTSLEIQQRIALEAALRIGQKYRKWDAMKWAYYSLFPKFHSANLGQLMGPGAVCSTLVSDSIFLATDTVISRQTVAKRPTFPADIAQSTMLVDVNSQWAKLEKNSVD